MDVELLDWPAETDRRRALCEARSPRLLLVAVDADAPVVTDPLEDWIRLPAAPGDLRARVESLTRRARRSVELDDDGLLRRGGTLVAVPPVEAKILAVLLGRVGVTVTRDELLDAAWPGDPPRRNVLDVHLVHLRRRIAGVGLTITTIRKRGYVLTVDDAWQD